MQVRFLLLRVTLDLCKMLYMTIQNKLSVVKTLDKVDVLGNGLEVINLLFVAVDTLIRGSHYTGNFGLSLYYGLTRILHCLVIILPAIVHDIYPSIALFNVVITL